MKITINHIKQSPRAIMIKTIHNLFAVIAITALSLTACTIGEEGDEWMPITSLSQIHGTWSRSDTTEPAAVTGLTGITTKTETVTTMIIYSGEKMMKVTQTTTVAYSGLTTEWATIKDGLIASGYTTFDDINHIARKDDPIFPLAYIDIMDLQGYRISHDDQEIKVPAGAFRPDLPELILTKE